MSDVRPKPYHLHIEGQRYIPPTNEPGTVCRVLFLPDDEQMLAAFAELVALGADARMWDDGGIGAESAASCFSQIVADWRDHCMIGAIVPSVRDVVPEGWLLCDGSSHAREDYPLLYAVLDAAFIIDADNFRTPDLRGATVIGTGAGYTVGQSGGAETHTLTTDEMPAHNHTTQPHAHTYNYPTINLDLEAPGAPDITGAGNPPVPTTTSATSVTVDNAGGGQAHNNMPPYVALSYYLVAK